MQSDRYGNALETDDGAVRDLYDLAMDSVLAADSGMCAHFEAVTEAAPDLALGHTGLARARHVWGDRDGARRSVATARALARPGSRAAVHVAVMDHVLSGRSDDAYALIRSHVADTPRDAMLAQMCTSVFGMIGFSGQPGREAELLAYTAALLPHYGEDWWMLSQHAFSLCETGQIDAADTLIDRALALNNDNANAAHVRSHLYYEVGETRTGQRYLQGWLHGRDRRGLIHGHLSWHIALWSLATGDADQMWAIVDADVAPDVNLGAPINVLTDTASLLLRAQLAGERVDPARWQAVSAYARQCFPKPGLGFVDVHAAIAHAMAGEGDALARILRDARGPVADLTRACAEGFEALAAQDWTAAAAHLTRGMADHARLGGSRAQRDVLEFSLAAALMRSGKDDEAKRLLALRRPALANAAPIAGLYSTQRH